MTVIIGLVNHVMTQLKLLMVLVLADKYDLTQ